MSLPADAFAHRAEESRLLAELGAALWSQGQHLTVTVLLSSELADAARAAWERDDESSIEGESPQQARDRADAGHLALIGLAVKERGIPRQDGTVRVTVDAWQIGAALEAADARGLLTQ